MNHNRKRSKSQTTTKVGNVKEKEDRSQGRNYKNNTDNSQVNKKKKILQNIQTNGKCNDSTISSTSNSGHKIMYNPTLGISYQNRNSIYYHTNNEENMGTPPPRQIEVQGQGSVGKNRNNNGDSTSSAMTSATENYRQIMFTQQQEMIKMDMTIRTVVKHMLFPKVRQQCV